MVKGIFVSHDWLTCARVKCEMLDFGAVKCDLFYVRKASLSIQILSERRIIDVN